MQLKLSVLLAILSTPFRAVSKPIIEVWGNLKRAKVRVGTWDEIDLFGLDGLRSRGLILPMAGAADVSSYPLAHQLFEKLLISPQLVDGATVVATDIDTHAAPLRDCDNIRFICIWGATDAVIDFTVEDSADGTTYAALKDGAGTAIKLVQIVDTNDNHFGVIEITRRAFTIRRYLQLSCVVASTGAGGSVAAILQGYRHTGELPIAADATRAQLVVAATH